MPKTLIKAFLSSFCIALFAIFSVNRVFWHENKPDNTPVKISQKNISLFLKTEQAYKAPRKKIILSSIGEIAPKNNVLPEVQKQQEVILAENFDNLDIPVEDFVYSEKEDKEIKTEESKQINSTPKILEENAPIIADVLYSPEIPIEKQEIKAKPIYNPENKVIADISSNTPLLKAPKIKKAKEPKIIEPKQNDDDIILAKARNDTELLIPLQNNKSLANAAKIVKIGNPKKLNNVALNDDKLPIQSMQKIINEKENSEAPKEKEKKWNNMNDSPWLVAKSAGKPKNNFIDKLHKNKSNKEISELLNPEKKIQSKGVEIASETVKNLIIPIPEKILNDEDLTPKLAYPEDSEDAQKEEIVDKEIKIAEKQTESSDKEIFPKLSKYQTPITQNNEVEENKENKENKEDKEDSDDAKDAKKEDEDISLIKDLTPPPSEVISVTKRGKSIVDDEDEDKDDEESFMGKLNSIFSSKPKTPEKAREKAITKAKVKRFFKRNFTRNKPVSILPKEIRLSFQNNRAEISGHTLRWIQAFAQKAANTDGMILEIRIDGETSAELQQKRLNLVYNILLSKGLDYSKIRTVFTRRDANSFVLRSLSIRTEDELMYKNGPNKLKNNHIQW